MGTGVQDPVRHTFRSWSTFWSLSCLRNGPVRGDSDARADRRGSLRGGGGCNACIALEAGIRDDRAVRGRWGPSDHIGLCPARMYGGPTRTRQGTALQPADCPWAVASSPRLVSWPMIHGGSPVSARGKIKSHRDRDEGHDSFLALGGAVFGSSHSAARPTSGFDQMREPRECSAWSGVGFHDGLFRLSRPKSCAWRDLAWRILPLPTSIVSSSPVQYHLPRYSSMT
jgi:hypothetical protein